MADTAVVETGGTTTDTPPAGATPAATPPSTFKVKVDGKEMDVTLDELQRGYSHRSAADQRMKEAAEQRQMAESVLKIFKENPREAFNKLGVDAYKFAESLLSERLEETMLSPEEKEFKRLKKLESDFLAKQKAEEDERKTTQEQAEIAKVTEQLQQDIIGAMQTSGLPKNQYIVSRIAFYMDGAIRAGYTNVTASDVVPLVKDEYKEQLRSLIADSDESALAEFLGEDGVKKTVKAHIAKVGAKKKQPTQQVVDPKTQPATNQPPQKKILSPGDFFGKKKNRGV